FLVRLRLPILFRSLFIVPDSPKDGGSYNVLPVFSSKIPGFIGITDKTGFNQYRRHGSMIQHYKASLLNAARSPLGAVAELVFEHPGNAFAGCYISAVGQFIDQ